jgi:hypothetical protein
MKDFALSKHAEEQIVARGIDQKLVWQVIQSPHQKINEGLEKRIYQSIVRDDKGTDFLIRVFVNVTKDPNLIITVYKTSAFGTK